MDWKNLFDPLNPRDIKTQEERFALMAEYQTAATNLSEPFLTVVKVNETRTHALLWHAAEGDQKLLFPITEPACEEFEYSHPSEWQVIFLGMTWQLLESEFRQYFKALPTDPPESLICLMALREKMTGFGGRDMSRLVFPCSVVTRVEQGNLIIPHTYCHDGWRPPVDPPPPMPFFLCGHARFS